MKDALLYIIKSIVDKPKKVEVLENDEEGLLHFTISVSKEDMGKIIGKEGKVIRAIRNVMKIPAVKMGKKIHITLSENPQ